MRNFSCVIPMGWQNMLPLTLILIFIFFIVVESEISSVERKKKKIKTMIRKVKCQDGK